MNQTVFSCGKSALSQLEKLIRSNRGEETLAALGRMYAEISRCEGTSPEYLRHLYCQIIFLFLHAAESHNVRAVTERTGFCCTPRYGRKRLPACGTFCAGPRRTIFPL